MELTSSLSSVAVTAFVIGFAGAGHCLAMCGGVASSLLFSATPDVNKWRLLFAYNFGRIFSYSIMGFLVAYSSQMMTASNLISVHILQVVSALLLFLLGLYIANWWSVLRHVERFFSPIFRLIQPISKRLLPLNKSYKAIPYGMIWGWLPCGLVYSALVWALASASAVEGFLIMLCFGLGTLPAIIATALSSDVIQRVLARPLFKKIMGIMICIYSSTLFYFAFVS